VSKPRNDTLYATEGYIVFGGGTAFIPPRKEERYYDLVDCWFLSGFPEVAITQRIGDSFSLTDTATGMKIPRTQDTMNFDRALTLLLEIRVRGFSAWLGIDKGKLSKVRRENRVPPQ
jgi:hypothetical protein